MKAKDILSAFHEALASIVYSIADDNFEKK